SQFGEADRNGHGEVVTVAAEDLVRPHVHRHVQVARRGAAQPGLTLPGQPDPLSVFDTGRDTHVDRASAGGDARAFALLAGVLDDRAAAAAFGARFGEAERALVAVDHARAV